MKHFRQVNDGDTAVFADYGDLRNFLNSALHLSFSDLSLMHAPDPEYPEIAVGIEDTGDENQKVVHYISGFMTYFARTSRLFMQKERDGKVVRDATTVTERYLREAEKHLESSRRNPSAVARKNVGDFALFMTGMFPEHLNRRNLTGFYEQAGASAYFSLYRLQRLMEYEMLADNFTIYETAISHARDKYMQLRQRNDGTIVLSPVCTPQERAV